MPSNFDTNATDLEDVFAPRSWFKLGPALYTWGGNTSGQQGRNDTVNRSSPIQVGSLTNWKQISAGSARGGAVKTDGTLWMWGAGFSGVLGLNSTIYRSSPVQIGISADWYNITNSLDMSVATKTDGTIWSWGIGTNGRLGLNNTLSRSSPVQIGLSGDWSDIAVSRYGSVSAIKSNGTLWAWGLNNDSGRLGLNDLIDRSSPTQVGTLTNWKQTSQSYFTIAVKTDGTLWGWGLGLRGQLGLNVSSVFASSPIQIGSLTNWNKVSSKGSGVNAIKTDGTLWSWGSNTSGMLGLNNNIYRSSPVQVGTGTNWKEVATGSNFAVSAIKTDGTLWSWGSNSYGILGLNDSVYRSSPVQVGALTNWKEISMSVFTGPILGTLNLQI
jgi:alpha-tubulin suppressor-like RCC1 family protein